MTPKNYVVCRNTAKVVKLKVDVLQLLNIYKLQYNVTPTRHQTHVARQNIFVVRQECLLNWSFIMSRDIVRMFAT